MMLDVKDAIPNRAAGEAVGISAEREVCFRWTEEKADTYTELIKSNER